MIEQTVESSVIWDAMTLKWRHCSDIYQSINMSLVILLLIYTYLYIFTLLYLPIICLNIVQYSRTIYVPQPVDPLTKGQ